MIEELTKNQGPFSKTGNVMLALDQIAKGEDLNQVTKQHLINIMKVLCTKLEWTEESNDQELLGENNEGQINPKKCSK